MAASVLVIGAGITGLATAVALQQQGFEVCVTEARDDVTPGAGISLWPNALAALDEIRLGDQVRAAGGRVTAGRCAGPTDPGCADRPRKGSPGRWVNPWW
ncbi:FAD-dependent oxidoreductase [Mycolicibacterium fortuitum]|nr:FAD-dependent oxidoreductase [Mycolicibacterium fortuitum]